MINEGVSIAEMYPYVCHVIFLATMTPEGREYLVRLNYLAMINSLLSQINEDYIRECQSTVSYGTPLWRRCHFLEYFSKLEASEIVSRVQTELIGALFNEERTLFRRAGLSNHWFSSFIVHLEFAFSVGYGSIGLRRSQRPQNRRLKHLYKRL